MKGKNYVSPEKSSFMGPVDKYHGRSIYPAMHICDKDHQGISGNGGLKRTHFVLVCVHKSTNPTEARNNQNKVTECVLFEGKRLWVLHLTDYAD